MKINNHGDVILYPVKEKVSKTSVHAKAHILQQSTTTGNRHEVVSKKKLISLWEKDGKQFIHCDEDYIIQHVGGDCEHGVQSVEAGTREVRREMEYDPWKNELKIIVD